jgi:hypothetical protein
MQECGLPELDGGPVAELRGKPPRPQHIKLVEAGDGPVQALQDIDRLLQGVGFPREGVEPRSKTAVHDGQASATISNP